MDFLEVVFRLIDLRSFSNIWFWVVLAVMWSTLSHFVIGVPFDLVQRARRRGGQALSDLETLAHIQARRRVQLFASAGPAMVGVGAAGLSMLLVLGFLYGVELAQAVFLLLGPASLTALMGLRIARAIAERGEMGNDLIRRLSRHRFLVQGLGMAAIFLTAIWGMWQNMSISVLGL
ncbi:component of SufBCD complex [Roseicitreum antarcticum]|uniref:Component of SufBCD complex n=1 Tax=Roseicitreum antarcticum TaxID=564137 RepID=A0A1H3BJP7_9RHOB|nr:component of SufBCD complex [Roseicitreum antarcticum]SDX41319.1 hypothetical protein SAMN04488238_10854 [Roseicitreum antarcticum]